MKRSHELAKEKIEKPVKNVKNGTIEILYLTRVLKEGDLVLIVVTCRENNRPVQWKGHGRIVKKLSHIILFLVQKQKRGKSVTTLIC